MTFACLKTVGMTKEFVANPAVAKMYDQARGILGYDLKEARACVRVCAPESQGPDVLLSMNS